MVGGGEFPGVREEDGDDFAGFESGGDQAAGEAFDGFAIFGIGEAAVDGRVEQGGFVGEFSAGVEDEVVEEEVVGIGVELGAQHGPGRL